MIYIFASCILGNRDYLAHFLINESNLEASNEPDWLASIKTSMRLNVSEFLDDNRFQLPFNNVSCLY